jgi:rubredoxin
VKDEQANEAVKRENFEDCKRGWLTSDCGTSKRFAI